MADADDTTDETSGRRLKLVRLIEEYDLDHIGAELERRWTAKGDDRMSLRDLADYFNRELLASELSEATSQPLSGEIENIYRLLTDDDVGDAERTRTVRRLERDGIAVADLQRKFVTYQAIRTYLTEHRGATHRTSDRPRTDVEAENLQKLRGRTASVTEQKLSQLHSTDDIALGDFLVQVQVTVLCQDCGSRHDVSTLLDRGGCRCDDPRG
jgi:hypothetical protein